MECSVLAELIILNPSSFAFHQPSLAGKQLTLTLLLCDGFCQIRFCLGLLGGNAILTCTLANEDEGLCNLSPDKPVAGSGLDNWHRLRWEETGQDTCGCNWITGN